MMHTLKAQSIVGYSHYGGEGGSSLLIQPIIIHLMVTNGDKKPSLQVQSRYYDHRMSKT